MARLDLAEQNQRAVELALSGKVTHVEFFVSEPVVHIDVPDTSGMSDDDAQDAMYDAYDATARTTGHTVRVIRRPAAEVRRIVRVAHARRSARRVKRVERSKGRARARGAGRPRGAATRGGDSGDSPGSTGRSESGGEDDEPPDARPAVA